MERRSPLHCPILASTFVKTSCKLCIERTANQAYHIDRQPDQALRLLHIVEADAHNNTERLGLSALDGEYSRRENSKLQVFLSAPSTSTYPLQDIASQVRDGRLHLVS